MLQHPPLPVLKHGPRSLKYRLGKRFVKPQPDSEGESLYNFNSKVNGVIS